MCNWFSISDSKLKHVKGVNYKRIMFEGTYDSLYLNIYQAYKQVFKYLGSFFLLGSISLSSHASKYSERKSNIWNLDLQLKIFLRIQWAIVVNGIVDGI